MLDFKIDSYIVLGQEKAFLILKLQIPFLLFYLIYNLFFYRFFLFMVNVIKLTPLG